MKYKLIKEYPGSPKLGTILTHEELQYCNWNEYYQEVVKKDYEILSLIEGKIIYPCDKYSKDYINQLFNTLGVSIHSVKRNDGEIFTIGDKVACQDCIGEIKNFFIYGVINIEGIGTKDNPNMPWSFPLTELWDDMTELPQKVKKPLFTTEDGVDIFEGDRFWNTRLLELTEIQVTNKKYPLLFLTDGSKSFSTKEKAEEYILMNKPCLSLKEVLEIVPFLDRSERKLKELVQQKLNK